MKRYFIILWRIDNKEEGIKMKKDLCKITLSNGKEITFQKHVDEVLERIQDSEGRLYDRLIHFSEISINPKYVVSLEPVTNSFMADNQRKVYT